VTDRVGFITGASRGVGAAVARAFQGDGMKVALASRSGDDLGLGLGLECDVSSLDSVAAAVDATLAEFGRLDVVVANAGVGAYGPFLEMDPDDVEAMIDVNLKGTLYTARFTLPHLIESKGDFVSLASVAGLRAFPGEAVYNASKFGMLGFTRALDHELREVGVRVTNIAPGGIATDFAMGSGRTPDSVEGMMSAEEVADVVLFAVNQPRNLRMMTVSFRPMNEGSWG
jgi:NAD(P)-dependent dehydrogenase (short-subunit alcohol dehydrogenase family)